MALGIIGQMMTSGGGGGQFYFPRETAVPQNGFNANTLYVVDLDEVETLNATFNAATDGASVFHVFFKTGAAAPTIVWQQGLVWLESLPDVVAGHQYELSVMEGFAILADWGEL